MEIDGNGELFYWIYFAMTGLHATHATVEIGILPVLAWRGTFSRGNHNPVQIAGFYWHFVDIVWCFLFPLLYLVGHR